MGYDVHITRRQYSWADAEDEATISPAEWQHYAATDPELQLAEAPADALTYVWLPYSKNGRTGSSARFSHVGDRISVHGPDEEILGKMQAVARALGARVQGDDDEYFDEPAASYGPAAGGAAWAGSDLRTFQTFASAGAAQPLLDALTREGIAYHTSLDTGQVAFDPSFANNQLTSKFVVQLPLADFERGSQLLADLSQYALSELRPDHYLFKFSDEELTDILVKPDEWSAADVALAGQLLRKRGRDISADALQLLRQRRVAELAQPDEDHKMLVRSGYITSLLGGVLGFIIGYQLYTSRKQLPDGRRVYSYSPTDRVHGLRIMLLATIVFVVVLAARLVRLMNEE